MPVSKSNQLPVGLIAELVECCTGIAEVTGSNPIQAWIFSGFNYTSGQKLCINAITNHVFIYFSAVQIYELSYIHLYQKNSWNNSHTRLSRSPPLEFIVGG